MTLLRILNPVARENTYLLANEQALIIIDPGSDATTIIEKIHSLAKPITAILLTHTHYDHIMSLDTLRETFGFPPVYVSEQEGDWLYTPELNGSARHPELDNLHLKPAENYFQYQHPYQLSGFQFYVRETPGHSIGGVSIVFPDEQIVFTGDALFRETIGRYDLPTGNFEDLITSIRQQLFTLPNHYDVYPGHGRQTTIAHEKNCNPYFQ